MATPKVFVSSTCYDLKEIRDNLHEFIDSLGYIPIFSDKNDVFYHPDLHTHEACIKEIENCQLFVLIIGGRFGGTYVYDDSKSIVNAEYDAAKKLNLPIFTFVQKEVYSNQLTYTKNIKNKISKKIIYPSIADQKYASNIFDFIISIRHTEQNNGIFEFEFARDIRHILKVQFSGLFYDFLWNRQKNKESDKIKNLLYDLTSFSKKTEELIENIYKKVEDKNSSILLDRLDIEDRARKFWYQLLQIFTVTLQGISDEKRKNIVNVHKNDTWVSFICRVTDRFEIVELGQERKYRTVRHIESNRELGYEWVNDNSIYTPKKNILEMLKNNFSAYKELTEKQRDEIIRTIDI